MSQYHTLSVNLLNEGKLVESVLVLESEIIAEQDLATILNLISNYVDSIISLTGKLGSREEQKEFIQHAREFLRSRLVVGSMEIISHILPHLGKLEKQLSSLNYADSNEDEEDDFDRRDDLWQQPVTIDLWNRACNSTLDEILEQDEDTGKLIAKLEEMSASLNTDLSSSDAEVAADNLTKFIERVKYCNAFDLACPEIELRLSESDEEFRVFYLQQAESIIRSFAVNLGELGIARASKLKDFYKRLNEISTQLAVYEKEKEARSKWNAFVRAKSDDRDVIKNWRKSEELISASIEKTQRFLLDLQAMMPVTFGTAIEKQVQAIATEMGQRVAKMAEKRQQNYDAWALGKIKTSLKTGSKHKNFFDDEVKIGEALIDNHGEIDIRLVSNEVQRAYSEVFELLFSSLDKDHNDPGGKLHTLEKMLLRKKKQLTDF